MKHFYLKFNHGVEIGARLAYIGHYKRNRDEHILRIAEEELRHQTVLALMLRQYGEKPSTVIDSFFWVVGSCISVLCKIFPEFMLNLVASLMEKFAIFSYRKLAVTYPNFTYTFLKMALAEESHDEYFKGAEIG